MNERYRILAIADQEDDSRAALRYACLFAKRHGYEVTLLHVREPAECITWGAVAEKMERENQIEAENMTRDLIEEICRPYDVIPAVLITTGEIGACVRQTVQEDPSFVMVTLGVPSESAGGALRTLHTAAALLRAKLPLPVMLTPSPLRDEE